MAGNWQPLIDAASTLIRTVEAALVMFGIYVVVGVFAAAMVIALFVAVRFIIWRTP